MFKYRDDKLGYVRSISLRNLYIDCGSNGSNHDSHLMVSKNAMAVSSDRLVRRGSLLPSIPSLESDGGELQFIDINKKSLLDSFYTLHVSIGEDEEKLIYISEIQMSDMNPNFSSISLPFIPTTCESNKLIINLWCRTSFDSNGTNKETDAWSHLSKYRINLRKLVYLGTKIDDVEESLERNSVIINLNGRLYTLPHAMRKNGSRVPVIRHLRKRTSHAKLISNSYSYDSIRSILKLSNSLNELRLTKHSLSNQIKQITQELSIKSSLESPSNTLSRVKLQSSILEKSLSKQKSINDNLTSEILTIRIKIKEIKETIAERFQLIVEMGNNSIDLIEAQLDPIEENLVQYVLPSTFREIQLYGRVLTEAFQIQNIDNSVRFSIMGLEFPSTIKELLNICYYDEANLRNFNDVTCFANDNHRANIEQINAGISYIVEVINIIAMINNCNLRYKMVVFGSQSIVLDPITENSHLSKLRNETVEHSQVSLYSLYYDAAKTERVSKQEDSSSRFQNYEFEHGLSLLNKNLVYLIGKVTRNFNSFNQASNKGKITNNIPIDCLDNLLWNLQYLLLFITAPVEQDD